MRWEILDGQGAVTNTVMATAEYMAERYPDGNFRAASDGMPQAAPLRRISVGAFFDRFGAAKYGVLADAALGVQALVKDVSVRQYIDLDRPDLPAGLQMLVDAGHAIDVQQILTAPIEPHELP